MPQFTLNRTGKPPLSFEGELIAEGKSPSHRRHLANSEAKAHWFEITVYRTTGGLLVGHIAYRWAGELFREIDQDVTHVESDIPKLMAEMGKFDATACVGGFPHGSEFKSKQEKLMRAVAEDYKLLTTSIGQSLLSQAQPEVLK